MVYWHWCLLENAKQSTNAKPWVGYAARGLAGTRRSQAKLGGYFAVRRYKFTVQAEPWTELALPFSMWILDHPDSSNEVHKAARGHIAATSDLRELFVDFCSCSWVLDSPDQIPRLCWITDHHGSQRCTFPAHADMVSKANPTLQILA